MEKRNTKFSPNIQSNFIFLYAVLTLILISSVCSCQKKTDENKKIESTLTMFSESLANADTATLRIICSSEFVLLDEGKFYDLPELFSSITSVLSTGSMERQPFDINIKTNGNVAWAHYKVRGEFSSEEISMKLALIESVVLERSGDKWLITQVSTMPSSIQ